MTNTELTIQHAARLRQDWLDRLTGEPGGPFTLDLGGVAEIDSAGVQLLLALRHSLRQQGRSLQLEQPAAAVQDALRTLGLNELLKDPT
jgi:anti-anti-sigma factor